MPVPMMFAITIEDAVTKPIVRLGAAGLTEARCASVVTGGLMIASNLVVREQVLCHSERSKKSLVICFEALWSKTLRCFASLNMTYLIPELSEVIPGITLKAA